MEVLYGCSVQTLYYKAITVLDFFPISHHTLLLIERFFPFVIALPHQTGKIFSHCDPQVQT